jgi:hypothetical protein
MVDLKSGIEELSLELNHLRAMERSEGWNIINKEAELYLAQKFEALAACKPEDVAKIQGMIAGVRFIMGHPLAVAKELERLEEALKAETTE